MTRGAVAVGAVAVGAIAVGLACSAPARDTPESMPTLEPSANKSWHCYRVETDERVSSCYSSPARCEAIQTEMAKRAKTTACTTQSEAACFSYWSESERKPLESCAVSLESCRARREVQLRIASGDTRQPTECEMWPAR